MTESNLFATFPVENTYLLPIGDNHFDYIKGTVTDANGNVIPMAKKTIEDNPLKYLWIDCDNDINVEVRLLGDIQYVGRVTADGFYFQDMTYDNLIIKTTAATTIQVIGSSSIIAGVGASGGGGGSGSGGGDIAVVESDIDGNNAQTTNSLFYGREANGVTHPVHVTLDGDLITSGGGGGGGDIGLIESDIDGNDAQSTNSLMYGREANGITHPLHVNPDGDLVTSSTPGAVIYGNQSPTLECVAGDAIEFDITGFASIATLHQLKVIQLTQGTYNYTVEIWEKDSAGYDPGTIEDQDFKLLSRDIDTQVYSENIEDGLLYRDQDSTDEVHLRIINNLLGTSSRFNVSIVGIEG